MEKVEIAIRVLSITYALCILIIILRMQGQDTSTPRLPDNIMLVTVFTMVFTCPILWAIIRWCRDWDARRRLVVLPDKAPKKRPDIAVPKEKVAQRTQAEILAEQRARIKELHGVGEPAKKKTGKKKAPKRAGPPTKTS